MEGMNTTMNEGVGLVELAPELMHKVALSGWLTFNDVAALSQTCRRMKSIFVDDDYGRGIHHAMKGVLHNVRAKRWKAARFAVKRKWFVDCWIEKEESVWREVAKTVLADRTFALQPEEELAGWESVMLAALSLPGASGWAEGWWVERMWFRSEKRGTMVFLLHVAAALGRERIVGWLLEKGAYLEARDDEYKTPLLVACESGCLGMVKKLVEIGADVTAKGGCRSVLAAASYGGHADVVAYLLGLGVLDVAAEGFGRWSSLRAAYERNHPEVVKLLVEGGADLEGRDGKDNTPLLVACSSGMLGVVRTLVECGADVDVMAGDTYARTPLYLACKGNYPEMVKVLIEGGADVDVEGRCWYGPLFIACCGGFTEIVRLLVDAGASSGVRKDGGVWSNGLGFAAEKGHVGVVQVLLDAGAGAGVDSVDWKGNTPLCHASRNAHVDVVRVLVCEGGADVDKAGQGGKTPLFLATQLGLVDVMRVLVCEGGADVDKAAEGGKTPLMMACGNGMEDMVRVLLELGADVGISDDSGETALDAARSSAEFDIALLLLEEGADDGQDGMYA